MRVEVINGVTFFCSHKVYKIVIFIFGKVQKFFLANCQRIIVLPTPKIVTML
jgi:hypothetical protein